MTPPLQAELMESPSLFRRMRKTPMRDVVRGRLTGRLDVDGELARSGLPDDVQQVIRQTVRSCRLWRLERADVARELIQHFQDAQDAGTDVSEAARNFGDTATAAKLIRRAAKRKRPLPWQMMRLAVKGIAAMILLTILLYGIQAGRVFLTKPAVTVDYREALNEKARAIPDSERAWPQYRAALAELPHEFNTFMANYNRWPRPGEDGWNEVERYLDDHAANIEAARKVSDFAGLGFIAGYKLSEQDVALWPSLADYDEAHYQEGGMIAILLPYLADIRRLAKVVSIDAMRQAANGDGTTSLEDIDALLAMSRHTRESPTLINDLVGHSIAMMAFDTIGEVMAAYPEAFTDDNLRMLAHRLAAFDDAFLQVNMRGERMAFADIIQRTYSDDGDGNGFLTAEGMKLFRSLGIVQSVTHGSDATALVEEKIGITYPVVSALVIDRKTAMREYDRYMDLVASIASLPAWERDFGPTDAHVAEWEKTPMNRLRHLPLVTLVPAISKVPWQIDRTAMHRDAVFIVLAAELYRRRSGDWPASLDDMVPELLPSTPIDRMTGDAMRYVIRDGRPLVYSVGGDREDDGGTPDKPWSYHATQPYPPSSEVPGSTREAIEDWILWPRELSELKWHRAE